MLKAVDYALASTPDSNLEKLHKPSENEKDEPFTESVDGLEVTTGNTVYSSFVWIKKKSTLKLNERHINLFLFLLSSENLLSILLKHSFWGKKT